MLGSLRVTMNAELTLVQVEQDRQVLTLDQGEALALAQWLRAMIGPRMTDMPVPQPVTGRPFE
jgi:hypothetical protein